MISEILHFIGTALLMVVLMAICGFAFTWGVIKACCYLERFPFSFDLKIYMNGPVKVQEHKDSIETTAKGGNLEPDRAGNAPD